MLVFDVAQSIILVGVCVYALISDIKIGKIRNQVILVGGLLSSGLLILKFLVYSQDDVLVFLKNAGIVVLLSLVGYITRIWAGGDCKLAVFIAIAYPTLFYFDYNNAKVTLWVFVALAFVLGFVYIIIDSIIMTFKDKANVHSILATPLIKAYLIAYFKCFVYLTAFNQIYSAFICSYFELSSVAYFIVSIMLVYTISLAKVLQNIWIVAVITVFDVVIMVITHNFVIIMYWQNYVLVIAFIIIRALVSKYNYKVIKTEDIEEGMVLSKVDTMFMHQYNIKGMPEISDETLRSRITAEEAQLIRRWGKSKHGKTEITIVRKVPFASFMSISLMIYLAIGVLQICGLL